MLPMFQPEPLHLHIHPRYNVAMQAVLCAEWMVPLSSPHSYSCHGEQGLCHGCSFGEEINSTLIGSRLTVCLISLPYASVAPHSPRMHCRVPVRVTGMSWRVL